MGCLEIIEVNRRGPCELLIYNYKDCMIPIEKKLNKLGHTLMIDC